MNTLFDALVDRSQAGRPDCVRFLDVSYSTLELLDAARSLAAGLAGLGIRVGDRVGIFANNCPEHVVLLLANSLLGAIHVGYGPGSTEPELASLVSHTEPKVLLVPEPLVSTVVDICRRSRHVPVIVSIPATDDREQARLDGAPDTITVSRSSAIPMRALLGCAPTVDRTAQPGDDVAIWYSSGTTGAPKGAVWRNGALCMSARDAAARTGLTAADRALKATAMAQVGLVSSVFGPILAGAAVEVLERFSATDAVRAIDRCSVTFTTASPTLLRVVLDRARELGSTLSTLRRITVGGGPASAEQLLEFRERLPDCEITYTYGATEGPMAEGALVAPGPKLGSPGRAYGRVRIVGEDGVTRRAGETGFVTTNAPAMMRAYWNDEALTDSVLQDGWLRMSDLGYVDDDGFIWLVGRAADLINCGGHNVFAGDIERVISKVDDVLQCAVIGSPDELYGEVPVAYVVLRDGLTEAGARAAIDSICVSDLARYKRPTSIHIVSGLPLSDLGKVMKEKLRSGAWLQELHRLGLDQPMPAQNLAP